MRDRVPGADQGVPNLSRERKVGEAVVTVVEVPEVYAAEPVDGGWWNPIPALARATPSRLLAETGPRQDLALDRSQQFVVHRRPPRGSPGARRISRAGAVHTGRKHGPWPVLSY